MADTQQTVELLLREGAARLRQGGFENPRFEARVLLAHVLGEQANGLLPGDARDVGAAKAAAYRELLEQRMNHVPVSRLIGCREFMGLSFSLSPATLDPRPDSEAVVELALDHLSDGGEVLDLGTGTGCLLLSLIWFRKGCRGIGVDLSEEAIQTATHNAKALGLAERCEFRSSDWFSRVNGQFDLIISNPPYIPSGDIPGLMPEVREHDPELALVGGSTGQDAYEVICRDAPGYLKMGGVLVLEIGAGQQKDVIAIAARSGLTLIEARNDLGGHARGLAFKISS